MNVTVLRNQLPREKWANRIVVAWQKQVTDIFEIGSLLESAKAELKHGEWMTMVKGELPFGQRTAQMLVKIATCDFLRDAKFISHLPAQWGVLHDLTTLTEEQFENGIKSGAVNSNMRRKDVKALRGDEEKTLIKKKDKPPMDLTEMCASFSIQITTASDRLPQEQRAEFFASLRASIDALETEYANG